MKKQYVSFSMLALAAALFVVSCGKENLNSDLSSAGQNGNSSVLKAGNAVGQGSSANGQGSLTLNDRYQTFAFHAAKDVNGDVTGSVETHSPGQDIELHADVVCLLVAGNVATVTAQVTKVNEGNPFGVVVGSFIVFRVKDNGEGAKAPVDQFSDYFMTAVNYDCNRRINFILQDIEFGNIQVKP